MKSMFHRAVPSVTAVGLLLLPLGAQVATAQPTSETQLQQALGGVKYTEATAPQFEAAVSALLAKASGNLKMVNAIVGAAVQARPDLQAQTINAGVAAMTASGSGISEEAKGSIIRLAAVSGASANDSQAKELLVSSLPSGVTLSSANDAQMEEAVKAAVSRDPRMAEGVVRVAIIAKVPSSERNAPAPRRAPRRRVAPRGDGKSTAANTTYNPWGASLSQSFAFIAAVGEPTGGDAQAKELLASSLPAGVTLSKASDAQMEEAVRAAVSRDPRMAEGIVRVAIITKVPAPERKAAPAPRRQRRAPRGDGKSMTSSANSYNPWATAGVSAAHPYVFIAATTSDAESYISAVIAAAVSAAPDRAAAIVAAATSVAPAYAATISQAASNAAPGQSAAISRASASATAVSASSESESYVDAIVAAAISAAPDQAVAIAGAAASAAPAYAVTITQTAVAYAPPALAGQIVQAVSAAAPDQSSAIAAAANGTTPGNTTSVVRATGLDAGSATASSAGTINPANISGTGTNDVNTDTSPSNQ